ncbi:MAG: GHKL domain-containing protein [Anaerolineales bacterium]|nr:GHKL domain-containing protein [Anaerolineales bacterium]
MNYFNPPLLSTGEPVSVFQVSFNILAGQETIIMLLIRYLRLEMEKSLHNQQTIIEQLQNEIVERHTMEVERENFIQELNRKNAELERFTYTVSHDLKSPLVTIKGFLGFLKKDLETNREDRIQKDFSRIEEATLKMGTLLSELLELSRIGRIINQPEQVDLVKLTRETLEMLDGRIRERNITVMVSPDLPLLYADRPRLAEVLENLIDNAAKYMGGQLKPFVEVGSLQAKNKTVIFIRDNGIGIEPKYHTKIFGLFEKLDSTSEGTGIGLALVKRIIETHGGRVWVESEGLGKGSTFCFTIPNKQ